MHKSESRFVFLQLKMLYADRAVCFRVHLAKGDLRALQGNQVKM